MIFDSHVHIPSPETGLTAEWHPFTPDLEAAVAYLRRCRVGRAIAGCTRALRAQTPEEMVAGNNETAGAVRDYPDLFVPTCQVKPSFGAAALDEVRRCHDELGMVWVGELFTTAMNIPNGNDALAEVVRTAAQLHMVAQVHSDDTSAMDWLCTEFPEATLVLPHPGDSPQETAEKCGLAAKHPNMYIDLSGHGVQRMGVLDLAVRCAGPERVLFGSDYTINDPAAVIATIQASYLDEDTKAKILGTNVVRMLAERGVQV